MKIQELLKGKGVSFKEMEHPPAYTAQEMAAEEHISGNKIAKTVVVRAGEGYAMCVLAASCKLDMKKVAMALGSLKVELADETELARLFPDTEIGAEPPFGTLYSLPTVLDQRLMAGEEITFFSGSHRQAIRMSYKDYAKIVQPTVADIAVHM